MFTWKQPRCYLRWCLASVVMMESCKPATQDTASPSAFPHPSFLSSPCSPSPPSSHPPPSTALTVIWDGEQRCHGPEGGPLQLLLLLVFLLDSAGLHLGLHGGAAHRGSIRRSMPAHRERRGRDRTRLRCWVGTPTPMGTLSSHRTAP